MTTTGGHAYGLATLSADGGVLDVWYPDPVLTTGSVRATGAGSIWPRRSACWPSTPR